MEPHNIQNGKRQAAIIVADISGLSSISQDTYPDRITELLTHFADACEGVITLYGGTIKRESGDKIISYFGLNDMRDNYASQAVHAALELRNRIEMMAAEHELPDGTGLRAGISCGEVITGMVGTGKSGYYSVIGTPVELAGRIQDLAEAGQILVGPEVFRQTQGQFEFHALEPMHLKGQKKPMSIYELAAKKKEIKAVTGDSARMINSKMVGREQEARTIEELIKQLLNGRGGVLNIEGVGGIGKSRLIEEIKAKEITGNIVFFEGRALSEGKNLSFHPIIQVIKSWAGITEKDNSAASFQKLSRNIMRIYPELAAEIIPFIATMMGYTLEGEAKKRVKGIEGEALEKLILKNVRDLMARAATIRPIVMLIEDVHWADLSSISFMESLFKLARNHRLLFINVFRPGFKETGEHLKVFVKENLPEHSHEIVLKPLLEDESAELILNLLKQTNLPEDIKNLIVRRSDGNPFFIEEVIRSFIDEGLVEAKGGRFIVTEQIQYANIPETIDKVILSRIERLDEKTKSLLKTASVIGRNFYYKVLEEAAQTIEELDTRLEYLKETQLLNESKHKEDVEFLFKHALAQQATYDSILQKTKKELHLKIARSIEKVFAEKIHEFYGILAMHYDKAEVTEKRVEYLVKAGDEAFKSGASNEAMNFYMDAIKNMLPESKNEDDYNKYKELEIKIGFAQQAAGNNIEAIETFNKLLDKYYGYRFPKSEFANTFEGIYGLLGTIVKLNFQALYFNKEPDEEFDRFMKIMTQWGEALTTMNPKRFFIQSFPFLRRMCNYNLAKSLPGLSIFVECASLFMWSGISFKMSRKILDYAKKAGVEDHSSPFIHYSFIRKMHDFHTGNFEDDRDYKNVFQTGMRVGDFWPTTIYALYSGMACVELGRYARFMELVKNIEEISESFDNSHAKAQMYRLSAMAHYKFRMTDRALDIAEEGIRYTSKTGHFAMLLVIWSAKTLALSAKNEFEAARKALCEAENLVADRKIITIYHVSYIQAKAQVEFSELRSAMVQQKPTRDQIRTLLTTINKLIRLSRKMRSAETEAYRLKALIYWLLRKQKIAYKYFSRSILSGQKYNSTLELARTYFEAGKCLRTPGSIKTSLLGVNSNEYLFRAKYMFEEMDLKWDSQEYERYMES